ncbi:Histone-lysine N-methyltransferase SMYD3 [Emericellopsis cladophorae]|uniref:Histone-lysine N-methyltransferase SMYD3 n=1 Tax=Emericellopsis cladophorae TaxID=2686198 RepID=A0A9Q0BIS5_9HYPO|nr:Histone-lysine N-methyltransferase SMYD3 [Emericellopsis cladophorae]KAI6785989.1 Histone-lysine N-methyltransferase SMYD3 [Emericellopsis cladophorae]
MSSSVRVTSSPTKGRALTSVHTQRAGTPILALPPTLLLPTTPHLEAFCTYCLAPGTPKACTQCHAAYYCHQSCQRAHWRDVHAKECKPLTKMGQQRAMSLPTQVRLLMQCLLKGESLDTLRGSGDKDPDIEMMAMAGVAYSGLETSEQNVKRASDIVTKIQTNAFNWADDEAGQIGVFLEPTFAMMNHTCTPNAMVQVVGRKIILRAERDIKGGEEIEISYTDYTWPKKMRAAALKSYHFECQCSRCKEDLNVYQVCAATEGNDLDTFSLALGASSIKQHPAATNSDTARAASKLSEDLCSLMKFSDASQYDLTALLMRLRRCKALVEKGLWAVFPLPNILSEVATTLAQHGSFPQALAITCLVAVSGDPHRYPATFFPVRLRALYLIAKLLSHTAADTAAPASTGLDSAMQTALNEIDQVALCQMLLMMVIRLAPLGFAHEWDLAKDANELLSEINQLPGRDREVSLIQSWIQNPTDEQSRAFFKFAVVDPVHTLADLGKTVISELIVN